MIDINFVTGNINKLKEAESILGIEINQIDIDLDEIQEIDIEKIINHKLDEAYSKTNKNIIVEDTGLFFESFNNLPGGLIKWFMKTVGNDGIIKMLANFENKNARAVTYCGYFDGIKKIITKGEVFGKISDIPKGENGFGWDKIFIPNGFEKTFAELSQDEKNLISMRKIAFEKLKDELQKNEK